jgi:DNA-directed RNA polymerase subunit M/transcription elongation factor TFIIS
MTSEEMHTHSTKKIIDLENSLRLTIPLDMYKEEGYSKERRQIILLFAQILDKYDKFKTINYTEQLDILVKIEKSCYAKSLEKSTEEAIYIDWSNEKFKYLYSLICSRVSKNLDINSEVKDTHLLDKIISKELDINKIGSMSSDDMSVRNTELKEQLNNRRGQKIKQKTTNMYVCRNCKGRECTIRQQQMRSLDEGTTLILNCTNCGFRFMIGA